MIMRSGYWFVPPLILIGCVLLFSSIWLEKYLDESVIIALTFLVFSILTTIFWFWVNNKKNDKILHDKETWEEYHVKKRHTIFFIQIQYIGIILLVLSLFVLYDSIFWNTKPIVIDDTGVEQNVIMVESDEE